MNRPYEEMASFALSHNYGAIIVVCLRYLPKINQNFKRSWVRVRSPEKITTVKNLNCELRIFGVRK